MEIKCNMNPWELQAISFLFCFQSRNQSPFHHHCVRFWKGPSKVYSYKKRNAVGFGRKDDIKKETNFYFISSLWNISNFPLNHLWNELEISEQWMKIKKRTWIPRIPLSYIHTFISCQWETGDTATRISLTMKRFENWTRNTSFLGGESWGIWICTLTIRKVLGCLKHAAIRL